MPGVKAVEHWGYASGRLLKNDLKEAEETASEEVVVYGPPPDTAMIRPQMIAGRWLVKEDESAVVITADVLKDSPEIKVGGLAIIKVGNRKLHCTVVGSYRKFTRYADSLCPLQVAKRRASGNRKG